MSKRLFIVFVFISLLCTSIVFHRNIYAVDECAIGVIEREFPDLEFTVPINIAEANSLYKEEVSVHETEKMAQEWLKYSNTSKKWRLYF